MIKIIFAVIIGAAIPVSLWILSVTFITWGFDPAIWTKEARVWFAIIAVLVAVPGALTALQLIDKE